MLRLLIALSLLAPAASAQTAAVRVDGVSIVGRWTAVQIDGDAGATADLARGDLTTVLAVNPSGHAILRGVDRRQGQGAPSAFSGQVYGDVLQLRGRSGLARLAVVGRRLALTDPRGRQTWFVRLDGGEAALRRPR